MSRSGTSARLGRLCIQGVTILLSLISTAHRAHSGTDFVAAPSIKAASRLSQATGKSFALARRYEHGEGVVLDYGRALELYCKAAREGDTRAFLNLGWMYLNGRGVLRDDAVAVAWLRKAARRGVSQAANLMHLLGNTVPSANTGCPPREPSARLLVPPAEIRAFVSLIAPGMELDAQLVLAVIATESGFNALAISHRNAKGLMQLMPETVARFGVKDPFDPEDNIRGGMTYLRWLLLHFDGNLTLALAAYNAGEQVVAFYGRVPPFEETIQYIERIKRFYSAYAGADKYLWLRTPTTGSAGRGTANQFLFGLR
jgi:transglycosylase-like protein with SLT domain/Sel1 repeat-containing protein